MSIESMIWVNVVECTGKQNTDKVDVVGEFYGWIKVNGRKWAIVRWCDDDDPDLCKAECLLISESRMVGIPD